MVRLVPCGVRECRQTVIDRERQAETSQTRKERKINSITQYVLDLGQHHTQRRTLRAPRVCAEQALTADHSYPGAEILGQDVERALFAHL